MKFRHLGAAALAGLLLTSGTAFAQTAATPDATATAPPADTTAASIAANPGDGPVATRVDARDHDHFPWGLLGLAGLAGLLGLRRRDHRPVVNTTVDRTTRP